MTFNKKCMSSFNAQRRTNLVSWCLNQEKCLKRILFKEFLCKKTITAESEIESRCRYNSCDMNVREEEGENETGRERESEREEGGEEEREWEMEERRRNCSGWCKCCGFCSDEAKQSVKPYLCQPFENKLITLFEHSFLCFRCYNINRPLIKMTLQIVYVTEYKVSSCRQSYKIN